jgi:hypothetical protein
MKTHIFIVNDYTFPIHLKYLFAGTGASYRKEPIWVDWHIELLADIKRVRSGDLVIFYIEGSRKLMVSTVFSRSKIKTHLFITCLLTMVLSLKTSKINLFIVL